MTYIHSETYITTKYNLPHTCTQSVSSKENLQLPPEDFPWLKQMVVVGFRYFVFVIPLKIKTTQPILFQIE